MKNGNNMKKDLIKKYNINILEDCPISDLSTFIRETIIIREKTK